MTPATGVATPRRRVVQWGQGSGLSAGDLRALIAAAAPTRHLSDGIEVARFEDAFCEATGARHAVATTSCTVALELAAKVMALQPGDEIITTALTFQATVAAYTASEVVVRFADIDPGTLCLDPEKVEALITPRTRAIYAVHYGGLAAGLPALRRLADDHGLWLVEDCAHAAGSTIDGRSAGTWGDFGCWSFHSLKNISTLGQGGMVTVRDQNIAERLRRLRCIEPDSLFTQRATPLHFDGYMTPTDPRRVTHEKNAYSHDCVETRSAGTNAQMSDPAAAVGRSQLARLDELVATRRRLAQRLDDRLGQVDGLTTISVPSGQGHSRHLYAARITDPRVDRDEVVSRLTDRGVEVVLRYFPLHLLPEWRSRGCSLGDAPVTERVWFRELLNLPLSPQLDDSDVDYVADAVVDAVAESRQGSSLC